MADDDLDPADWLASQFGEEEAEKAPRRRGMPAAQQPAAPPPAAPQQPPVQQPPATTPFFAAEPYTPPAAPPASPPAAVPPASAPPVSTGGGFNWGLTPGGSTPELTVPATPAVPPVQPAPVQPAQPAPVQPVAPAEAAPPFQPPPLVVPPVAPPAAAPEVDHFSALFGQQPAVPAGPATPTPVEPSPHWDVPTQLTPTAPEAPGWDVPTQATPVFRHQDAYPPAETVAFNGAEVVRQEFPGFGAPVDPAIEGVTEVFGAQPIGLGAPEDEGIEVNALDSLFGESKFVEYEDALIPSLPPRASGGELVVVERPITPGARAPIPRTQKILMAVAGGLVAVLALIALFLAGSRIAANTPAPAVVADPTPSASAGPVVGPVAPGEYYWDQLLGGECIAPFTSPWEDTFTVVDCTQPHPAQLVLKGTFPATDDPAYPGVDALQALAASLCAVPTVIDYAAAASANDIQVLSSFAADEADWTAGNRTFYCFVNRTGGAEFTTSIAKPQVLPTATATPSP